jgi:hypothetical protein
VSKKYAEQQTSEKALNGLHSVISQKMVRFITTSNPTEVKSGKVNVPYKPGYAIPCVGNLIEEKSCVIMFVFSTGI